MRSEVVFPCEPSAAELEGNSSNGVGKASLVEDFDELYLLRYDERSSRTDELRDIVIDGRIEVATRKIVATALAGEHG